MAGLTLGAVTLDTGALLALERNRRDVVRIFETARERKRPLLAPANAVVEWWRGRTDRREYVRKMFVVQAMDEEIAKLAGEALASLKGRVEIDAKLTIDATVMATAALYGPNLYTGDFEDMQRFAEFFSSVKLFGLSG
jgi:hypothetical protein